MEIDAVPEFEREKDKPNEKQFRERMDRAANDGYTETHITSVVGTKFSTTWKRGERASLRCINEISTYYIYRDDGKLLSADSGSTIFYESIQEHLHKESTITQLDTWLCTYRTIILQSKAQAARNKKEKEKAIKAAKSNMTNITNSPPRRYHTRQQ